MYTERQKNLFIYSIGVLPYSEENSTYKTPINTDMVGEGPEGNPKPSLMWLQTFQGHSGLRHEPLTTVTEAKFMKRPNLPDVFIQEV